MCVCMCVCTCACVCACACACSVHIVLCVLCACVHECPVLQGMFGFGQSTAKFINKETNIQTKFRSVGDTTWCVVLLSPPLFLLFWGSCLFLFLSCKESDLFFNQIYYYHYLFIRIRVGFLTRFITCKGEFYTGGFVLRNFIELVTFARCTFYICIA